MNKTVAIIGSGSWGIALGNHLGESGNKVKIWSFTEEEKDYINNKHTSKQIPEITINENVVCSNDIKEVVEGSDFIIHVTPSKFTRNVFNSYKEYVGNKPIIICSKGFEESTLNTLDQVILSEMPNARIAALSGPSYATEVINHIPTAVILASKDERILEELPQVLSNEFLRVYKSKDIIGVEVGGALKNIIAFCAGICAELNFGTNAWSALITRGLAEIARLGVKMGGEDATFYGLSGLGDLILTCSSDESRNRRAGRLIGKGLSLEEARKEIGMTIESADNIKIAKKLQEKYNVDMPIVESIYDVLYNGLSPKDAAKGLMTRKLKFEID